MLDSRFVSLASLQTISSDAEFTVGIFFFKAYKKILKFSSCLLFFPQEFSCHWNYFPTVGKCGIYFWMVSQIWLAKDSLGLLASKATTCTHSHLTRAWNQIPAAPFLILLSTKALGKADENSTGVWGLSPTWETQAKFVAPGFTLANTAFWTVSEAVERWTLSRALFFFLSLHSSFFFPLCHKQ